MKKAVFLAFVVLIVLVLFIYLLPSMNDREDFVQCLVDSGVVVYVSDTCPACTSLANEFGGYDAVEGLFVNCNEKSEICEVQMQTNTVPEVQYEGDVLEGMVSVEDFSKLTGCEI